MIEYYYIQKLYPEAIFYISSLTIMKKFILWIMTLFLASKINEVFPCFFYSNAYWMYKIKSRTKTIWVSLLIVLFRGFVLFFCFCLDKWTKKNIRTTGANVIYICFIKFSHLFSYKIYLRTHIVKANKKKIVTLISFSYSCDMTLQ